MISKITLSQDKVDEIEIVEQAISIEDSKLPIVYIKRSIDLKAPPKKLIDKIQNGIFYETESLGKTIENPSTGEITLFVKLVDSLILSDEEKKVILNQLKISKSWDENLLENSIRVENLSDGYRMIKRIKNSGSIEINYVFSFSVPIFLRENTICMLALTSLCGDDCGKTDISFYKRINNVWKKWISFYGVDY